MLHLIGLLDISSHVYSCLKENISIQFKGKKEKNGAVIESAINFPHFLSTDMTSTSYRTRKNIDCLNQKRTFILFLDTPVSVQIKMRSLSHFKCSGAGNILALAI